MKAGKALGVIFTILGGLAVLAGLLAWLLPIAGGDAIQAVLDALYQPPEHFVKTAATFVVENRWLVMAGGLALIAVGTVMLILCAKTAKKRARRAAEERKNNLIQKSDLMQPVLQTERQGLNAQRSPVREFDTDASVASAADARSSCISALESSCQNGFSSQQEQMAAIENGNPFARPITQPYAWKMPGDGYTAAPQMDMEPRKTARQEAYKNMKHDWEQLQMAVPSRTMTYLSEEKGTEMPQSDVNDRPMQMSSYFPTWQQPESDMYAKRLASSSGQTADREEFDWINPTNLAEPETWLGTDTSAKPLWETGFAWPQEQTANRFDMADEKPQDVEQRPRSHCERSETSRVTYTLMDRFDAASPAASENIEPKKAVLAYPPNEETEATDWLRPVSDRIRITVGRHSR